MTSPHLALITAHPGRIGGMEKFARFIVRTALTAGWNVTVGLSGEDIFSASGDPGPAAGGHLHLERIDWVDATFAGDRLYRPGAILARRRWFSRIRPDVALFVQSSNTPFRAAVAGAALAGVPAVITHRTMPYVIPPVPSRRHVFGLLPGLGLYRRKMVLKTRLVAALAGRIVYNSEQVRREYERDYRYPVAKGRVIPNAVDMPADFETLTHNASAAFNSSDTPLTIGYVGRLSREKRLDVLLRAVATLRTSRPVRLALWGDGPERAALTALATDLGLTDRITWHGATHDVWAAYRECDIVVLTSPRESSSNMILEALAAGRAVVVTRVGGQPELVENGRCGVIVPPGDPAALAQALDALIDNDALCAGMGTRAREIARARHDPARIARAWLELLSEAAGLDHAAYVTSCSGQPPCRPFPVTKPLAEQWHTA